MTLLPFDRWRKLTSALPLCDELEALYGQLEQARDAAAIRAISGRILDVRRDLDRFLAATLMTALAKHVANDNQLEAGVTE